MCVSCHEGAVQPRLHGPLAAEEAPLSLTIPAAWFATLGPNPDLGASLAPPIRPHPGAFDSTFCCQREIRLETPLNLSSSPPAPPLTPDPASPSSSASPPPLLCNRVVDAAGNAEFFTIPFLAAAADCAASRSHGFKPPPLTLEDPRRCAPLAGRIGVGRFGWITAGSEV